MPHRATLQHLVRAYQSDLVAENHTDETQSVHDMNTSSVGHLLHEMVTIYGLCGDTISALLEAVPGTAISTATASVTTSIEVLHFDISPPATPRHSAEAAGVEDNLGRLPLHVACDRDAPWMDMVEAMVDARPDSLNRRDGGGRLPLHVVLDRQMPSVEVRFLGRFLGHFGGIFRFWAFL